MFESALVEASPVFLGSGYRFAIPE